MIEKKTKCSEMALPVSFNLLIVEQHNTITKTVFNVFAKCLALFANSLVLSIQPEISSERQWFEAAEQQSVQFWWLPQDRFPRLPTKLPRNFEEEMESCDFNSEKQYFLWMLYLFYFMLRSGALKRDNYFFVIVDCQVVKHRRKDGLKLIKYFRHL